MEKQIRNYIRECVVCQRCKYDNSAYPGLLQPLPIPEEAWSQVSLDFIEGLPMSHGKSAILVVVDRLTKYAHFMSLSHPYKALSVAQTFLDNVFKLHGLPNILISDRDTVFLSKFWCDLFKLQGVELNLSTAYHPQSDGQTEVVNRCLESYLRCMSGDQPIDWSKCISLAEFWYNTSHHSSIDCSPFEALYGYPPLIHIPYFRGDSVVHSVDDSLGARDAMIQVLKHHLVRAQKRMKQNHDRHRSDRVFAIGDWVYLKLQPYRQNTLRDHQFQKLGPRYFGPFKVIDKFGEVAYKLQLPPQSKLHLVFHVSQLKKKKKVRASQQLNSALPTTGNATFLEPVQILERRLVKRGNRPATQVLVHWSNSFAEDATWEFLHDIQARFPQFKP
ncbi:hypothetical protein AAHA92_14340 [Salvia divinorum]|uniref:Integrase catalytic domain-containing protein n=1 Tax=Salvia divinorum TaxID=28513 RepID=A0ABD1HDU3_SALDI